MTIAFPSDQPETIAHRVVRVTAQRLLRLTCRVDAAALAAVPARGPLILVANHINFLEVPVMYTQLWPRPMTGLAKVESFRGWLGPLFRLMGAIPLHRGEGDAAAFRRALAALQAGAIVAVAPEGTRSNTGRLAAGQPGIALLLLHSRAPLLPIGYWGSEQFWPNLRRLRRTDFTIAVGPRLRVEIGGAPVNHATRQAIADEVMLQIARLLPPAYHGAYAGRLGEEPRFLRPAAD